MVWMKGHMAAAVRTAAMLLGQFAELLDPNLQEFGIGREDDVLGLHRGVHCDPGRIALIQGADGCTCPSIQIVAKPSAHRRPCSHGDIHSTGLTFGLIQINATRAHRHICLFRIVDSPLTSRQVRSTAYRMET
jgi:hypothetical protein